MIPSIRCILLIQTFEGLSLVAYLCPAGVPTIGYGHTAGISKADVGVLNITSKMATDYLSDDLKMVVKALEQLVRTPLNQNQFNALVSFTFNIGNKNLANSTLLVKLNSGRYDEVPAEMQRWNKAGQNVLPGLVRRREAESKLWNELPTRTTV
jgi:lysozyme